MAGVLDVLERLQELDTRIHNLEKLRADLPRQVSLLKSVVDSEALDLQKALDQQKVFETAKRDLDRDIEETQAKLKHAEEKLGQITNNQEYQAAQKENAQFKKRLQDLEGNVVGFTERLEAAKKRVAALEQTHQGHISEYESQKNGVDSRVAEINEQLEKHMTQRKSIVSDVQRPLLSRYERLFKSNGGIAVSQVVNGVCQACHFALTSQRLNMIRRADDIYQCDNCQRILVYK